MILHRYGRRHLTALPFVRPSPGALAPGAHRYSIGHLIKPSCQNPSIADRIGLACQHEERGLECVFRILVLVEDVAANTQDHGTMTGHDGPEGHLRGLVVPIQEPVQQRLVAHWLLRFRGI